MANTPTTNTVFLKAAIDRLQAQGIPETPLLDEVGLKPADIDGVDGRVSLKKTMDLYELIAERTEDPCFGLHVGSSLAPRDTGVLGYVLINCNTVEEAIDHLIRYIRLYADGSEVGLSVQDNSAILSYRIVDPGIQEQRQDSEMALAFMLNVARTAIGNKQRLREVHFSHGPPVDDTEHRQIFQAELRFNCVQNALIFDESTLRDRINDADPALLEVLQRHAEDLLNALPDEDGLTSEIRRKIGDNLRAGEPRIESVAKELGMSTRTLQRRLLEEGTSFRSIVDELRRHLAIACVGNTALPFQEIAYLLGYSDFSAFHHAFRRWTGRTPLEFRRHANSEAA